MSNANNMCHFIGRFVKDPEYTTVGTGQNAFGKVRFTLAVDRVLTKKQREAKKNNEDVTTADFVQFEATGPTADLVQQYFVKGKPVIVTATFETYSVDDKDNPGKKKYGYKFKVDSLAFVPKDTTDGNSSGGNGNSGSKPSNNKPVKNTKQADDDFEIDDGDIPF